MASLFTTCLMFCFLVAACNSAPYKIGGGIKGGGSSRTDFVFGGDAKGRFDGLLFTGDASGKAGAKWNGEAHGAGVANVGNTTVATQGVAEGALGGAVDGAAKGKFGMDKDKNIHTGLMTNFGKSVQAEGNLAGELGTGEDAKPMVDENFGGGAADFLANKRSGKIF